MSSQRKYFFRSLKTLAQNILFKENLKTTFFNDNKSLSVNYINDKLTLVKNTECKCALNGFGMVQGKVYSLSEGDIITVNDEKFVIVFDPPVKKRRSSEKENEYTTPTSKRLARDKVQPGWETGNKNLFIYHPENHQESSKIASFDLDGTIIKTKSGSKFAKDEHDWVLFHSNVKTKLKNHHEEGYKIVFFTNQKILGKTPKSPIPPFQRKVEAILKLLEVPVQVFISVGDSIYRKPAPGMWDYLVKNANNGVDVDVGGSFYVGDAAGRIKNWRPGAAKDHSSADRLFALNLGLKFLTPETFFNGFTGIAKYEAPKFNPKDLPSINNDFSLATDQEIIIMVGSPASGKTKFCKRFLIPEGYVHISRDVLGSQQNCITKCINALNLGQRVVVDNINTNKEARKKYLELALKHKVNCRCFILDVDKAHVMHNEKFREYTDPKHAVITDMIIHTYFKNFEEPTLDEGFTEIVKIHFSPEFDDENSKKLYYMYLL